MNEAARRADVVARRFGRDPWRVARRLQIAVEFAKVPRAAPEIYVEEPGSGGLCFVVLDKRLSDTERGELLAHALGHRVLHAGDRLRGAGLAGWSRRQEREADDFAACLLISGAALRRRLEQVDPPQPAELAEHFGVDSALMRRRMRLLAHDG